MTMAAPTIRIPRARLLLEQGNGEGVFLDRGRVDNVAITLGGDPTIREDFDPTTCTRYEVSRDYLRLACTLTADLVSGEARNVAEGLLSAMQAVSAGSGLTKTTPSDIVANDLIDLGWSPDGSSSGGVFTPDTVAGTDSDDPANDLTEDTDWEWYDARNGIIKILNISGFTLPFVFTGDSRATSRAVIGDGVGVQRAITLVGVDHNNSCTGEVVRLWKTVVQPGAEVALSQALDSDDAQPLGLTLDVLPDITKAATSTLGQFGYWDRG